MGKENAGVKRTGGTAKSSTTLISKTNLQKELTKQWSLKQGVVSQLQVIEDGYAVIVVRNSILDTTIVCKGLANQGNSYGYIMKLLRLKGFVSKREKVDSVFVKNALAWEAADPVKETFRSGDHLLMVVTPAYARLKKSIEHRKGKL